MDSPLLARLESEQLSILACVGEREVYRSALPGVRPLLELVDRFPQGLSGGTIADRIVGGCAARVFVHLRVAEVLGIKGSAAAAQILRAAGISSTFSQTVSEIRNRDDSDICPFERLSRQHRDPLELITAIRAKLAELRAAGV